MELKEMVVLVAEEPPCELIMYYSFNSLFTYICLTYPLSPSFANKLICLTLFFSDYAFSFHANKAIYHYQF